MVVAHNKQKRDAHITLALAHAHTLTRRPTQTSANALPCTMRPLGKGHKGRGYHEMSGAHEVVRNASP